LTRVVGGFRLKRYAEPLESFYALQDVEKFIEPHGRLPEKAYGIHLWNEVLRWRKISKDRVYDETSILGQLQRRYL
jgi:hypothetical protein